MVSRRGVQSAASTSDLPHRLTTPYTRIASSSAFSLILTYCKAARKRFCSSTRPRNGLPSTVIMVWDMGVPSWGDKSLAGVMAKL